jgi:hypothetical protein
MVHNDPISSKALNAVAEQIASAIQSGVVMGIPRSTLTPLALGRTLAVWGLKPRVVEAVGDGFSPRTLDDWARPLNRWHHQIKLDQDSGAFARSLWPSANPVEPSAEESVASLRQLSVSPKAEKIERGILWVEQNPQRDPGCYGLSTPYEPLVRLLETSAYRTTALLLVAESEGTARVLVVDSPTGNEWPKEGEFFEPAEFLRALSAVRLPRGIT